MISTQEEVEDTKYVVNEPDQMDATYLAINLAFIPDNKRSTFSLDTSEQKPLF